LIPAVSLLFIGGQHSAGYSYYLLGALPVVWLNPGSVRFLSPATFPSDSEPDLLVRSAMGAWNLVPAANFAYSYFRPAEDLAIDHFDGYNQTAAVPAWQLDAGVLGVTYLVNDGPYWFDADILFSDLPQGVGYTFDPFPNCEVLTQPTPVHGFSFLLIALHELGHGLGLGHDPLGTEAPGTNWFVGTMNPRYPSGGTIGDQNIIELHTDDRNGIRFLYPHTGPSRPTLADLANSGYAAGAVVGRAVPVSFEPAHVGPGEEVILQSVVENFGTTNEFFVRQGFYLSTDPSISVQDTLLGFLTWDLGFQQALQFEVAAPIPDDLSAGPYYLGSILDDLDDVPETFEDNNAVRYCAPLIVDRVAPVILPLGQDRASCEQTYRCPRPAVTKPLNMSPITWSLDNPEPGMTIRPATGEVVWPQPIPSPFLYTLILRATNSAGSATQVLYLGVEPSPPAITPVADQVIPCGRRLTGPQPQLTSPRCMEPVLLWSLTSGPADMAIDPDTGVVSWAAPVPSQDPYPVEIRALNAAGHGSLRWTLTVPPGDLNGDSRVTEYDIHFFLICLAGPRRLAPQECRCADSDRDGDVDLADVQVFQATFGY
jgi:hypothetical protein